MILHPGATGVRATAATASSSPNVAIPLNRGGFPAKRVRISVVTATETAHVLPVVSSSAVVTTGTGVGVVRESPVILDVSGYTHIAHIRGASADVVFNITPLED